MGDANQGAEFKLDLSPLGDRGRPILNEHVNRPMMGCTTSIFERAASPFQA